MRNAHPPFAHQTPRVPAVLPLRAAHRLLHATEHRRFSAVAIVRDPLQRVLQRHCRLQRRRRGTTHRPARGLHPPTSRLRRGLSQTSRTRQDPFRTRRHQVRKSHPAPQHQAQTRCESRQQHLPQTQSLPVAQGVQSLSQKRVAAHGQSPISTRRFPRRRLHLCASHPLLCRRTRSRG